MENNQLNQLSEQLSQLNMDLSEAPMDVTVAKEALAPADKDRSTPADTDQETQLTLTPSLPDPSASFATAMTTISPAFLFPDGPSSMAQAEMDESTPADMYQETQLMLSSSLPDRSVSFSTEMETIRPASLSSDGPSSMAVNRSDSLIGTIQSTPLTSFTCFPKLPAEIRLKIYGYMLLEPTTFSWYISPPTKWWQRNKSKWWRRKNLRTIKARSPIPAAFHLCFESRLEALKYYGFEHRKFEGSMIFRRSVDTIHIPFPLRYQDTQNWRQYFGFVEQTMSVFLNPGSTLNKLERLMLDLEGVRQIIRSRTNEYHYNPRFLEYVSELPCKLPRLRKITFNWSAHDLVQVEDDSPMFPDDWSIEADEVQEFVNQIVSNIQEELVRQDIQRNGHRTRIHGAPGSRNRMVHCRRDTRSSPHSSVEIVLNQVLRVGDYGKRKPRVLPWKQKFLRS